MMQHPGEVVVVILVGHDVRVDSSPPSPLPTSRQQPATLPPMLMEEKAEVPAARRNRAPGCVFLGHGGGRDLDVTRRQVL
jgi:hypothetical protein